MSTTNSNCVLSRFLALGLTLGLSFLILALVFLGFQASATRAAAFNTGLVFEPGGFSNPYNNLSYQGLLRAETDFDVDGTVYMPISDADLEPRLMQCVTEGNDLCLAVGFRFAGIIHTLASSYPSTMFAIIDYAPGNDTNLRGIVFVPEQVGYLAGTLAGYMTDSDVIGAIGGMPIPPVDSFLYGYRNGARCANPAVSVPITYTHDFGNPALGEQAANWLMDRDADVIFPAAGPTGDGALLTATDAGAWAIGVDYDQYTTVYGNGAVPGADHLLSSAMKKVDNAVYDTIGDLVNGIFTPGIAVYSLAEDGVGLAPYHDADPHIPAYAKAAVETARVGLINGEFSAMGPCSTDYDYIWTDYFDEADLSPLWYWVREDPSHWSLADKPGYLKITTQSGSIFQGGNDQKNLLLLTMPPGDFQVTSMVDISPSQNYQYAGLHVYQDDDNYIQINRAFADGQTLNFDVEVGGVVTNTRISFTHNEPFLRIRREGTTYTGLYSEDGLVWSTLGQYTADFQDISVGLGAANNLGGLPEIPAEFAFFTLEGDFPGLEYSWTDDFNGAPLHSNWGWINENPTNWSLSARPGFMRMMTYPGAIWEENLLVQSAPQGIFDISTRQLFTATENFEIAGLSVYIDGDNYLMLGRAHCDVPSPACVGNGIYFDKVLSASFGGNFATAVAEPSQAYLRIVRGGDRYFGFYSENGQLWMLIGGHEFDFSNSLIKIGLSAGQDYGSTMIPADFDYFRLAANYLKQHIPLVVRDP